MNRGPPPIHIKPSLCFRYIYFDERPHGNSSCITETNAPYGNKKTRKHQSRGVKRVPTHSSCTNRKSETTMLNPDDVRSKERRSLCKKFSIYLWIAINRRLRSTSIIDRKQPDTRIIYNRTHVLIIEKNIGRIFIALTVSTFRKIIHFIRPDIIQKLIIIRKNIIICFIFLNSQKNMLQISKLNYSYFKEECLYFSTVCLTFRLQSEFLTIHTKIQFQITPK